MNIVTMIPLPLREVIAAPLHIENFREKSTGTKGYLIRLCERSKSCDNCIDIYKHYQNGRNEQNRIRFTTFIYIFLGNSINDCRKLRKYKENEIYCKKKDKKAEKCIIKLK
ncbi:MAG: hypothetical protein IJ583_06710 [Firmicutes bacterium]|nr:hypothetical protein [Bacillota bacterium]